MWRASLGIPAANEDFFGPDAYEQALNQYEMSVWQTLGKDSLSPTQPHQNFNNNGNAAPSRAARYNAATPPPAIKWKHLAEQSIENELEQIEAFQAQNPGLLSNTQSKVSFWNNVETGTRNIWNRTVNKSENFSKESFEYLKGFSEDAMGVMDDLKHPFSEPSLADLKNFGAKVWNGSIDAWDFITGSTPESMHSNVHITLNPDGRLGTDLGSKLMLAASIFGPGKVAKAF